MDLGGYSARGPREVNEDNYYYLDFSQMNSFSNGVVAFAMVSDGMGGYQGGDIASQMAVDSAQEYLEKLLGMARNNQVSLDANGALAEIIQSAHASIVERTMQQGSASMGATFVGAFISPAHAWIAHVGDSRAYLIRDGQAFQLTEDHSQVGKMLSRGLISEEEAQNHPARNRIERALGFSDAKPDFNETDLLPGDELLLCSDGVYTVIGAAGLAAILSETESAQDAAQYVVESALNMGTDDNSTAVVAALRPAIAAGGARRTQPTLGEHNQPRHAASGPRTVRQTAHSDGGRAAARQSANARQKKSAKRLVIPLVVVAVLAIAVVFLILNAQSEEQNLTSEVGTPSTTAQSTNGTTPENGQAASGNQATGQATTGQGTTGQTTQGTETGTQTGTEGSANSTTPAGFALFTISAPDEDGALLKYIGIDGTAHTFDEAVDEGGLAIAEELIVIAHDGLSVQAETTPSSYGLPGRSYRALASTYLDDLVSDCEKSAQGDVVFTSNLSRLFDTESYRTFIAALSQSIGSDGNVKSYVKHLAFDSDCLLSADEGSYRTEAEQSESGQSEAGQSAFDQDDSGQYEYAEPDGYQSDGYQSDGYQSDGYQTYSDDEQTQYGGMEPEGTV